MPREINFEKKIPWWVAVLAIGFVILLFIWLYSPGLQHDHARTGTMTDLRGIVQGHVLYVSDHGEENLDSLWPVLVESGYLPEDLGPGCLDAWGQPIVLTLDEGKIETRSLGPDRVPSKDDLVTSEILVRALRPD